jgi:murein DD-endopeptidase MepM/ murein hydrolase activator NlpD
MAAVSRVLICALALASIPAGAQSAYRYKDANGNWVYTDRAPPSAATRDDSISLAHQEESLHITIERHDEGTTTTFTAINNCLCIAGFQAKVAHSDDPDIKDGAEFGKLLQPQTQELLVTIHNAGAATKTLQYAWRISMGSPNAQHRPPRPYRVPFAVGSSFTVSQAFPDKFTHVTAEDQYAVDIALPDGTPIYAAREGTVINVHHELFRGGLSPAMMDQANVVEILHDDGTIAMYAHLHWDSVRVHIGQHVDRGQYIANSGSTGFSSGPHLHFCVFRNLGFTAVSVPVQFAGPSDLPVTPQTRATLTAY